MPHLDDAVSARDTLASTSPTPHQTRPWPIGRLVLHALFWSALIAASGAWHLQQNEQQQQALALQTATTTAAELMLLQRIEALNTEFTGLSELLQQRRVLRSGSNQTTVRLLPPAGPASRPGADKAPKSTDDHGDKHAAVTTFKQTDGTVLRLQVPITITPECLNCHRTRPYQLGSTIGAMEISVPLHHNDAQVDSRLIMILLHSLAWLTAMGLLWRRAHRSNRRQAQIAALTRRLRQSDLQHRADTEHLNSRLNRTNEALDGEADARKKQKERLTLFTQALQQTPVGIMVVDWLGHIQYANPKACEITEYTPNDLINSDIKLFCSADADPENYRELSQAIRQGKYWQGQLFIRTCDSTLVEVSESAFPMEGRENYYSIIVFTRNDTLDFGEQTLRLLAYYDPVSHLPNRREFQQRLEFKIEQMESGHSKGFALVYLDLDDFGALNDQEGHQFGNKLLKTIGQRLRHSIRGKDVVARLDADLFGIILSDIQHADIIGTVVSKMRTAINGPMHLEQRELHITASIGVTICPDDSSIADRLLHHADVALYRARRLGTQAIQFYAESVDALSADRIGLRRAIEEAIAADNFQLAYLPTRPVGGGDIDSAEILLRMDHPRLGEVPPETFLQVAEDTGLIISVGNWVFEQALREASTRRRAGHPNLPLTFNVSQRQLEQANLPETLLRFGIEHGFPSADLGLEFREDAIYNGDQQLILDNLSRLHEQGVRLVLDRFGSGLFSLRLLNNLPLNAVKIDRAFIHALGSDTSSERIIATIINLAKGLSLTTIASGVESNKEEQILSRHGCDRLQGKLCAMPMDSAGLSSLLGKNH